ncbi:hypothetical protein OG21DRAFT_1527671 [Imleria badia]|nr:hypothetical protein OG21DRAFT_1527671 [Imleria badia]
MIDILNIHGIKITEVNGLMLVKHQQLSLEAFHKLICNKDPYVLILSNIVLVGLNLACANIMVIIQKQVHFYHLIMLQTSDIFLNNILDTAMRRGKGQEGKSAGKGKARTEPKSQAIVISREEFNLTTIKDSSESDEDQAASTSKGKTKKAKSSKCHQSPVSSKSPKNRKCTHTKSMTQESTVESLLAQPTAMMQVDEIPTEFKGKEMVDDQATPKNAPIFRRASDVDMPLADLVDPVLAVIQDEVGQESPKADE